MMMSCPLVGLWGVKSEVRGPTGMKLFKGDAIVRRLTARFLISQALQKVFFMKNGLGARPH